MIEVGHRQLAGGRGVARSDEMQVEDHVQVGRVQSVDVARDDRPIGLAAARWVRSGRVQPQPAVLVERDPDDVDVPALHCGDHRRVVDAVRVRTVEEPPSLDARVLQT